MFYLFVESVVLVSVSILAANNESKFGQKYFIIDENTLANISIVVNEDPVKDTKKGKIFVSKFENQHSFLLFSKFG